MSLIERCARALYVQAGKKWLDAYPFESAHPIAVEARERATEQARRVLAAADYEGAVDVLRAFPEQTSSDTDGYSAWLPAVRDWNERRRALLREQP